MNDIGSGLLAAILILVLAIVLFVIFRQVVLWYFRINEQVQLLKDIRDSLRERQPEPVRRWPGESDDEFNSRA